ncbi:MAG: spore coat protein [Angelakisella sp.]
MAEINAAFGDKEILQDMLASQKKATSLYDTAAGECSGAARMTQMLTLLGEEHKMQFEIFQEMQKRGWYPVEQAEQKKIDQAKERFCQQDS